MSSCLRYYASRELDSIARIKDKKYIKNTILINLRSFLNV
jgi:hypothetical protein